MKNSLLLGLSSTLALAGVLVFPPAFGAKQDEATTDLNQVFQDGGIQLNLEGGYCSIEVTVAVRDELLEYLLTSSYGAAHESLFVTKTNASLLNTAFLTLGVEPGSNAHWTAKVPAPTEKETQLGASAYEVTLPQGDGFFIYAAWEDEGERYFYRVEDLVRNLSTGRCMSRHRWIYLGSRMVEWEKPGELKFAADVIGNLINVAYFEQGDTMLTGAIAECVEQSIWMGNSWLLPKRGDSLRLVFSRERLGALPADALPTDSKSD